MTLPDIDLVVKLKDVGVGVVEVLTLKGPLFNLGGHHGARSIAHMPKLVLQALLFSARRRLIRHSRSDRIRSATHGLPESILDLFSGSLEEIKLGLHLAVISADTFSNLAGLAALEEVGIFAIPAVELQAQVENKAVTIVKAGGGERYSKDTRVALALDVKEFWLVALRLDVLEA